MKLYILIALGAIASISSADIPVGGYKTFEVSLEVPADPSNWVFQGDDGKTGRESRLSNGARASDTQFPWIAELSINTENGGLLCTASLISDYWLIGSQFCINFKKPVTIQVSLGSADRFAPRSRYFVNQYAWVAWEMDYAGINAEIALFKVSQKVFFSSTIKPIRLPEITEFASIYENEIITAAGWGNLAGGGVSRYLQWTQSKILPFAQCNQLVKFCSRALKGAVSFEYGDNGGSSVIYENGTPTLIGINQVVAGATSQQSSRVNFILPFIYKQTGIPPRY